MKRGISQQGIFVTTTVTLLVMVVALVMTGAYQWALADWETVGTSVRAVAENLGKGLFWCRNGLRPPKTYNNCNLQIYCNSLKLPSLYEETARGRGIYEVNQS